VGVTLLINTMLKTKWIERDIPELGPIIMTNSFQVVGMFIVQPQRQASKVLNTSSLLSKKKIQE
jgi:hypothetical protein